MAVRDGNNSAIVRSAAAGGFPAILRTPGPVSFGSLRYAPGKFDGSLKFPRAHGERAPMPHQYCHISRDRSVTKLALALH
jgi:hypothetical protein